MGVALNTVHQGDCIELLTKLQPGTIDLAFADPPFNIGYEYDVYDDRRAAEDYLDWSKKWIAGVYRALKPEGAFWLAIGDEFAAELKLIAQKDVGFHCRSWVIWYYTFGVNCKNKFTRSHAHLFHFVKDPKKFTFNADDPAIRVPSARQLVYADARANPNGRLPDDTWILRPQDLPEGFSADSDVWFFSRVAGTFKERAGFHGCQMPERLLARIICACSTPGEIVLDPFAGSASTLIAAKKLGRECLGFELSKDYAQKSRDRLSQTAVGDELIGPKDPLKSAPTTANGKQRRGNHRAIIVDSIPTPVRQDCNSADLIAENSLQLRDRGIVEAFRRAANGFSVDRLIADPELNAQYVRSCYQFGIAGDPATWNRQLLRLRKSKLLEIPATRTTRISKDDIDSYCFASEIAWRDLDNEGWSLDDILCDPTLAGRFDALAMRLAPGYSSLQYRWAALKIRKRAHDWRNKKVFGLNSLMRAEKLSKLKFSDYQGVHGAYILRSKSGPSIYVGEACDLGLRLEKHLETIDLTTWADYRTSHVRIVPRPNEKRLGAMQANLIRNVIRKEHHHPHLNVDAFSIAS